VFWKMGDEVPFLHKNYLIYVVSYPIFWLKIFMKKINKHIFLHQMHCHEYFSLVTYFKMLTSNFSFFVHIFIYFFYIFYFVSSFSRKLNFITPNIPIQILFISIEFLITKFITLHHFFLIFFIFKYHKIQINFKNSKKH